MYSLVQFTEGKLQKLNISFILDILKGISLIVISIIWIRFILQGIYLETVEDK